MALDGFEIKVQLGTGRDGVAYRAIDLESGGREVEVRDLSRARSEPARWAPLTKRIHAADLVIHPSARRVEQFREGTDPPILVLSASPSRSLLESMGSRVPIPRAEAVRFVRGLAGVIAEAHRLGVTHGALGPRSIRITATGTPLVDFTGTDVGEPYAEGTDPLADVTGMGEVLNWLVTGDLKSGVGHLSTSVHGVEKGNTPNSDAAAALDSLLAAMFARNAFERPTARVCQARLDAIWHSMTDAEGVETIDRPMSQVLDPGLRDSSLVLPDITKRERLGRYVLREKLGQGGMGEVYRGEDLADGTTVALKVLRPEWAAKSNSMLRFRKEARLLSEVNNPYVTNLLEVNEDDGIHYLVLEYVSGQNLGERLADNGALPEPEALAIISDVARALIEAHARGIIHRDIKPDNILLSTDECGTTRVKLSDFGLARHVDESESLQVTQDRAVVGTPQYMSPEQGSGGAIDPSSDVYSMGITLFRMLAGHVPFSANGLMELIALHCNEPPPTLRSVNPSIGDGVSRIVSKALAKSPNDRYPDAESMLVDIDRLLRGELTPESAHPKVPGENEKDVLKFDFQWDLESSPRQLWPLVTNTERLNQAIGLPPVTFRLETDSSSGKVRRFGQADQGGIVAEWEEHPFEWVEPRRMGVLRNYSRGPFRWMVSAVELVPRPRGGTTLHHRIQIAPRGLLMRAAASFKVGRGSKNALERVYRRIDETLSGKISNVGASDPFEVPPQLPTPKRRRLEKHLEELSRKGITAPVVQVLGDFIANAPAQEVTRIRPYALARRLGLDPNQVVSACLEGARIGLFVLMWDILCPLCRIPSEVKDTLKSLKDHGHCEACNLDYELDFANSVEMIFRVHPEVREADLGVYCIGGPAHSPHVVAQVRVAPGERVELDLGLSEGFYEIRGPRLPYAQGLRVEPSSGPRRFDLNLKSESINREPTILRAGAQSVALLNDFDEEVVVRIERTASRDDALTAARASSLAQFRELFPGEVLSQGQLINVAATTFLLTGIEDADALYAELGDARAFGVIHEHVRLVEDRIRKEGGALVKTVGEGMIAVFSESGPAVRLGLDLSEIMASGENTGRLRLRASVHRGPAMAVTINDHLDYFGLTVAQTEAILRLANPSDLVFSSSVASDSPVMASLRARGREAEVFIADLPGAPGAIIHRVPARPRE